MEGVREPRLAGAGDDIAVRAVLQLVGDTGFRVPSRPPEYRAVNRSIHKQRSLWTERALICVVTEC